MRKPRSITALGPSALLLEWEPTINRGISESVHAYQRHLFQWPEVVEAVPAYASLLLKFDCERISAELLREQLYSVAVERTDESVTPTLHHVPVRYDGPDLPYVAEATGLSAAEVIELHASVTYYVYQLGFLPGFAFLGDLPKVLHLPRRSSPRTAVPPGAVAIAGAQTAIYPQATPGGWLLIGRCPLPMLIGGPAAVTARFKPGDSVKFEPISADQYNAHLQYNIDE